MNTNHPVIADADAPESLPQNIEVSAVTSNQNVDVLARLRDRFGFGLLTEDEQLPIRDSRSRQFEGSDVIAVA